MAEWIHKFISDKKSFREQYDVAMHRAMLKDESLQPLSIKNSKKQRTNAASTKSSDSAAARKNTHNNNNNNNEKKDEHREEASLIEAAKEAAARVAKKRLEEQETQRLKKIQAQKKIEDDFKNGIAPAQDYIDDEMSEWNYVGVCKRVAAGTKKSLVRVDILLHIFQEQNTNYITIWHQ